MFLIDIFSCSQLTGEYTDMINFINLTNVKTIDFTFKTEWLWIYCQLLNLAVYATRFATIFEFLNMMYFKVLHSLCIYLWNVIFVPHSLLAGRFLNLQNSNNNNNKENDCLINKVASFDFRFLKDFEPAWDSKL